MYHAKGRLPQPLPPTAYYDPDFAAREAQAVLRPAWHMVGTTRELARGTMRRRVVGAPVRIERAQGEVTAHLDLGPHSPPCRVALCGQLIFVALDETAPSLADFLGDLHALCLERFGDNWTPSLRMDMDYPTNWKAPVENSLEAYHVPSVHPGTFSGAPAEADAEHHLLPHRVELATIFAFGPDNPWGQRFQRLETAILKSRGAERTGLYRNILVFPNLMLAFTDSLSSAHVVLPRSPTTSYGLVRQFGRVGRGLVGRAVMAGWNRLGAQVSRTIMTEDLSVFDALQRGLEASRQPGMFGRNEERVHHFQTWMAGRVGDGSSSFPSEGNLSSRP